MSKKVFEVKVTSRNKTLFRGSGNVRIPSRLLNLYGSFLVTEISKEAKRAASVFSRIPDTPDFYNSFTYSIENSKIIVESSWPWIDPLVEGTEEFKMDWLTKEKGVSKIPIFQSDGSVIFRNTPLRVVDAWIHPAITKHSFIQNGVDSARRRLMKALESEPSFSKWFKKILMKAFERMVS